MYVCGEHTVELGLCIGDFKVLRNLGVHWCLLFSPLMTPSFVIGAGVPLVL
jgi:hypothetical protein